MKEARTQLPPNPFDQGEDPKKVMRELLKKSKPISREEALRRMKEAAALQARKSK